MEPIRFTASRLTGTNKAGKLSPNQNGNYVMPIGGLNAFNSRGEYYVAEGAKDLFQKSSIFIRRIESGCVKAELGHPKRLPGMSTDDFIARLMTIEETNVCAALAEVWLDLEFGKKNPRFNNPDLIGIMAEISPSGPHGESLRRSLENGSENVCFSIRALTRDYYQRGKTYRVLESIMTFDQVVEPGLDLARKWDSPVLESLSECTVRLAALERIATAAISGTATEDSRNLALEAVSRLGTPVKRSIVTLPTFANW